VSPDTIRFVHALAGAKGALVFAMNGASPIAERCEAAIDFRAAWQFEESRHRLALADWLKRAGGAGATPPEATPPDSVRASTCPAWARCAASPRELAVLGYLAEMTTFTACASPVARRTADACLRRLLDFVARDDIAHARFFEAGLRLAARQDARGTLDDVARVAAAFIAQPPLLAPDEITQKVVRPLESRLHDAAASTGTKPQVRSALRAAPREPDALRDGTGRVS
jgi:hypothetical protein